MASSRELLEAQAQISNLILSYINSFSLKCALELGIPDIIHKHSNPITLSQLALALNIGKSKSNALYRLMRILVHSNIFERVEIENDGDDNGDEEREAYSLTRVSRLLLRDEPSSFAPWAIAMVDPVVVDPFQHVTAWFCDESPSPSPFFAKNGMDFWEFAGKDDTWNRRFNEAMACDARLVSGILVKECKQVFEGLEIVVDVAGGTGEVAAALAAAFPGLKAVVLDLPQVVAGLEDSENLRFVGGDMFEFIPPADAVFLKWIIHDWSDENSIKILKNCREAVISSKNPNGGKVIIVDMVVDGVKKGHVATEAQLLMDMLMLTNHGGKERSEKEWSHLFSAAGFSNYKITHILGLRSVIEVFP